MNNDFEILVRFLDRCADGDVEGHILESPPPEVSQEMRAFARGELNESGRERLVAKLQDNPQWVALLAAEVQALRPGKGGVP